MSTSTLNIAILGAGIFAREAHLPALGAIAGSSNLKLQAVYSRSRSSATALAELAKETLKLEKDPTVYSDDGNAKSGLDELLASAEIQAVIVVLPITQQPDVILRALKAGKHVLSEKPVGKDVRAGSSLINTYETEYKPKGLVWRVAENFECEPGVQAAAELVKGGKIGKVTWFKLVTVGYVAKDNKWYKTAWRTVPEYQGGFLLDGGVHWIALLRTVLSEELDSVSGFATLAQEHLLPHDTITASAKTASGTVGVIEMAYGSPSSARTESKVTITGTEGFMEITFEPKKTVIKTWLSGATEPDENNYPQCGVEKEIHYFAEAIRGSNDLLVQETGKPQGALHDVAVIQAGLTSNGSLIKIKSLSS